MAGRGLGASSLTDFVLLTCQIPFYPSHTRDSKHLLSANSEPVLSTRQPIEPPYRPVMWSFHLHPPARKQPQRCSLPASEHTAGWWQREATHPAVQQALFNTRSQPSSGPLEGQGRKLPPPLAPAWPCRSQLLPRPEVGPDSHYSQAPQA